MGPDFLGLTPKSSAYCLDDLGHDTEPLSGLYVLVCQLGERGLHHRAVGGLSEVLHVTCLA